MDYIQRIQDSAAIAALFEDEGMEYGTEGEYMVHLDRKFLVEMRLEAVDKYTDYLKEQLLNGQGDTLVEIGLPIDCSGTTKGKNFF